jgi:hypothetical protein
MSRHPKPCKFYNHYGKCKFNPCAIKHVENVNTIESSRKDNEKILENIAKYDKSKIVGFSLLNEKLQQVENKLDRFKSMEQKILKKDGFENLLKRVDDFEANLCEKDNR